MPALTPEQYEAEREKHREERLQLLAGLRVAIARAINSLDVSTVKLSEITGAIRLFNDHTRIEFRPLVNETEQSQPVSEEANDQHANADPLATISLKRIA